MAKHSPDLFKKRSATQEFLFSHSETITNGQKVSIASDKTASSLDNRFPDMLDRQGLAHAIDTRMASASTLIAIGVRIEWPEETQSDGEQATDIPEKIVMPMASLCRTHNGCWARIGIDRFALVFPTLTDADGHRVAHKLLNAHPAGHKLPITIGVATYPTLNYTRSQIVENAEKALDHANFFGPGTVTGFNAVSLNINGDRHYQAGDIAGAIDAFKKGLLLDPSDVNLHNSLGVCYGVLKCYHKALAAFENAIWLAPEEMMALYNKGYILLLKGEREQALKCFVEADARESDVFEVAFHIGQTLMEMNAPEKARSYLEAATRSNNRSGPAFKSLGACLDKLGLTREAIQAYKRVVKINPVDADALSTLGQLYTKRGESLDVALVLCEQSVRLSPDDGIFRHRLGGVYLNQGKLDLALAEFELAVALGHNSRRQIETTQDRMMAAKAS